MNKNNNSRQLTLFLLTLTAHVVSLFLLWFLLRTNDVVQPVYENIISAKLSTDAPSSLPGPPLEDQFKKDEEAWQKEQDALAKAEEAKKVEVETPPEPKVEEKVEPKVEEKVEPVKEDPKTDDSREKEIEKKKELDKAKELEEKKIDDAKKAKELADKKKAADKKAADAKKAKELADKKAADAKKAAKELADKIAKEKAAKAARDAKAASDARAAADRAAENARQGTLSRHVSAAISQRLTAEWRKGVNSAIQFADPNDFVTIVFTIARDGKLQSARIAKLAQNPNLNSKAQTLIALVSATNYRFPPFDPSFKMDTMTIPYDFKTE